MDHVRCSVACVGTLAARSTWNSRRYNNKKKSLNTKQNHLKTASAQIPTLILYSIVPMLLFSKRRSILLVLLWVNAFMSAQINVCTKWLIARKWLLLWMAAQLNYENRFYFRLFVCSIHILTYRWAHQWYNCWQKLWCSTLWGPLPAVAQDIGPHLWMYRQTFPEWCCESLAGSDDDGNSNPPLWTTTTTTHISMIIILLNTWDYVKHTAAGDQTVAQKIVQQFVKEYFFGMFFRWKHRLQIGWFQNHKEWKDQHPDAHQCAVQSICWGRMGRQN